MLRNQRHGSWNAVSQDELKVGRHTIRLKRSLAEGGFAFIHLVEVSTTVGVSVRRNQRTGVVSQQPQYSWCGLRGKR